MRLRAPLIALIALVGAGTVASLTGSDVTAPPTVGVVKAPPQRFVGRFGTSQNPTVGETLGTSNGNWSKPVSGYSYQWQDCTGVAADGNGTGCSSVTNGGGGSTGTGATYVVQSSDVNDRLVARVTASFVSGGSASQSSLATGVVTGGGAFPLSVSANGRYLQTSSGVPFLVTGDGPQGMIPNVGNVTSVTADANTYFSTRQAQGFNTALIDAVADDYTGGPGKDGTTGTLTANYGHTYDNVNPFTSTLGGGTYNLTAPNSTYWQRVAQIVGIAKSYGFAVWLVPIDTGGWMDTIQANCSGCTATSYTGSNDYKYGQFLGCTSATYSSTCSTLGSYGNVIWSNGNDFGSYATNDVPVQAIAEGIKNTNPTGIQTVEFNETGTPVTSFTDPCTGPSTCIQSWKSIIGVDGTYVYPNARVYDSSIADYNQNLMPVYGLEFYYENENSSTQLLLRQQAYQTLLAGGNAGQFYGEHYVTFFCTSGSTCNGGSGLWTSHTGDTGATYEINLVNLFSGLNWQDLVPDQISSTTNNMVTAGQGTDGAADYVTSAKTADGTLGLAYDSGQSTITVQLGSHGTWAGFAGSVTARWYDPTDGSYTAISGSPFTNSGTHNFTPPTSANAGGDNDWVLVLQAS